MALSNSERQARYKQRLKAAAVGVTPEMIHAARKAFYHALKRLEGEQPDWEGFVAASQKRGKIQQWIEMLPDDVEDQFDWVEDAGERELLVRVAPVIAAIMKPPA
jgi:hypothetical protein